MKDSFGRRIDYLRFSVTDRCDLRCFYCMPEGSQSYEAPEHWLTFDEIARVVAAFASLGVSRVRLTGGEPLVRPGLPALAGRLKRIEGVTDLSLSTNASRLSRFAEALAEAGVDRLNVSLDSLNAARFQRITKGKLDKVLAGLNAAKRAHLQPVKLNMVVMKGINDDEVEQMLDFCLENGFVLRLIETMPMGSTGQAARNQHYVNLQEVKARLARSYDLVPTTMPGGGPARYYKVDGRGAPIGFITPISQHFCETCNRVRLGVEGTLYLCLGNEHSLALRPLLRAGISDNDLAEAIQAALLHKPWGHLFDEPGTQVLRFMSMTGG